MSMTVDTVENILCSLHNKEHALLTGNATSGIYLALKAFGLSQERVALPNNICINIPVAVRMSGNIPEYFDISERTMGLSVQALQKTSVKLGALIAVHSYGSICDIDELRRFCREKNILLIEDFAVAQGATVRGVPAGSMGDISITSFGAGKIIDIGHGGAILTNDGEVYRALVKLEKNLRESTKTAHEQITQLSLFYKRLYNEHYGRDIVNHIPAFLRQVQSMRDSFLFGFDDRHRGRILNELRDLQNNIARRNEKARLFHEIFDSRGGGEIISFMPPDGSVYWRFNIFLKGHRNRLLKYLLSKKFRVSSWYPSVDIFFETDSDGSPTPVSDRISDEILNLWVNHEADRTYIRSVADEILSYVEREQ